METPLDCTNATDFTHYANLFSRLGMAVSAEQLPWDTPQLWNSCWVMVRMWRDRSGEELISLDGGPIMDYKQLKDVVRPEQFASQKLN